MPRREIYVSLDGEREFNGRAEYLDYLRVRRAERLSWARLVARREIAMQRLLPVRECSSFEEIEDFLNERASDLSILSGRYDEETVENIRLNRMAPAMVRVGWNYTPVSFADEDDEDAEEVDGEFPAWKGRLLYDTRPIENPRRDRKKKWIRDEHYDLPRRQHRFSGPADVLKKIGVITGSGSGLSNGAAGKGPLGSMGYEVYLFECDFDHMRVMLKLAA